MAKILNVFIFIFFRSFPRIAYDELDIFTTWNYLRDIVHERIMKQLFLFFSDALGSV